jgi:hypothetical protein
MNQALYAHMNNKRKRKKKKTKVMTFKVFEDIIANFSKFIFQQ